MRKTFLTLFLFILICCSLEAVTYREFLDAYTGRWKGTLKVSDSNDKILNSYKLEQTYWWENDTQRVIAVFEDQKGRLSFSESKIYMEKGKLICDTSFGNTRNEQFVGRIIKDVLIWEATKDKRTSSSTLEKILYSEKDTKPIIHTETREQRLLSGKIIEVCIKGNLKQIPNMTEIKDPSADLLSVP